MYTSDGSVASCPHMVALMRPVNGSLLLCSGTVLSRTLTLTAAHCVVYGITGMLLTFGTSHLFKGGIKYRATKAIVHPQFDTTLLANDIAVVSIFPAAVSFNERIKPVRLPEYEVEFEDQMLVTVYGWGATSSNVTFSNSLRKASLPFIKKDVCKSRLMGTVPPYTFCLGFEDGHADACLGDSGGPAMLGALQIGIISFGEGCGIPRHPGVYTDIFRHTKWLKKIKQNEVL